MILKDSFLWMVNRRILSGLHFNSSVVIAIFLLGFSSSLQAKSNRIPLPKPSSFRGISIGLDQSIWISGSRGVVLRCSQPQSQIKVKSSSITSQIIWDTVSPEGYDRYDFRDIESKDSNTAIIMSVSDSARILKSNDGGKHWKTVYQNFSSHVFLDAIDIDWKSGIGLAIGDPQTLEELIAGDSSNAQTTQYPFVQFNSSIQNTTNNCSDCPNIQSQGVHGSDIQNASPKQFLFLISLDTGNSWHRVPFHQAFIPSDSIASFFAGSGSSLIIIKSNSKINKFNQIETFNILVGMAGGGENPVFRVLKLTGEKNTDEVKSKTHQIPHSTGNKITNPIHIQIESRDYMLALGKGAGWGAYGGTYFQNYLYWVGGNYLFPAKGDSTINSFSFKRIPSFNSKKIAPIKNSPTLISKTSGYKSGICGCTINNNHYLIAAGINGVDISKNQGTSWQKFFSYDSLQTKESEISRNKQISFNSVACYQQGVILIGNNGFIKYLPIMP